MIVYCGVCVCVRICVYICIYECTVSYKCIYLVYFLGIGPLTCGPFLDPWVLGFCPGMPGVLGVRCSGLVSMGLDERSPVTEGKHVYK